MSWKSKLLAEPSLAGYRRLPHPTDRVLVVSELADELRDSGILTGGGERVEALAGGREPHPVFALPGGTRVVMRRYRRGGLMRHLNRGRYFLGNRALHELRVTARAIGGGVRAPQVVAAVERPESPGYSAWLLTRFVPDARELAAWLDEVGGAARETVLHEAGIQIARMHAAGIAHPDLNLRNFLVSGREGTREVWVLDFDRATAFDHPVASRRRARDLARLGRSIRKIGVRWDARDDAAIRAGYGAAWPLSSPLARPRG